ncbi:MAG: EpsG family protein, partial [Quisquiliibacterium sp.]
MWPYWLMFLVPAALAVQEASRSYAVLGAGARRPSLPTSWWLVLAAFTLMLGWRHEVGGDWGNYLRNFAAAFYDSQYADWWWNDPGYRLLEWLSLRLDWDIYGVNLMAAALFSYGLVVFCRHLPRPWLALAVAVPYLVIILGMGYSRQGAALGAIMVGLVSLGHGKVMRFVLWTLLGATMHKSGVLLLPLAALAASRNRWLAAAWVGVVVASAYALLLQDSVEALQVGYLEAEYQSQGALIRLVMNTLPALVLLARRRRFE